MITHRGHFRKKNLIFEFQLLSTSYVCLVWTTWRWGRKSKVSRFEGIWGLTWTNTSALHILHCLFMIFKFRGRGDETTLACASIHWKQNRQKTKSICVIFQLVLLCAGGPTGQTVTGKELKPQVVLGCIPRSWNMFQNVLCKKITWQKSSSKASLCSGTLRCTWFDSTQFENLLRTVPMSLPVSSHRGVIVNLLSAAPRRNVIMHPHPVRAAVSSQVSPEVGETGGFFS